MAMSLRRLVSQCVDLAQRAGGHIRAVSKEGSLHLHDKGEGTGNFDPQTLADRQAQRCIVENLRAVHPELRMVGEEGDLGPETAEIELRQPRGDLLDAEWPSEVDLEVPISELCVWIDPLDGTKEFTEGRYEFVSTLIGISQRQRPVAGVISEPYKEGGRILWGCCVAPEGQAVPGVHVYGDPAWVRPMRPPGRCLAVVSRSRAGGAVAEALRRLRPLVTGTVQLGGAGHKVARVVDGLADLWLFPRSGTSRWDTCAAEAMLEAAGGVLTDRHGERICYDPDGEMVNTEGVLAAASGDIVEAAVKVCDQLEEPRPTAG